MITNLHLTPARVINRSKVIFSDHYAIILKFKDIPLKSQQHFTGQKYTTWNTNKVGGWDKYKELTDNNTKLYEVVEEGIEDGTEAMIKYHEQLTRTNSKHLEKSR